MMRPAVPVSPCSRSGAGRRSLGHVRPGAAQHVRAARQKQKRDEGKSGNATHALTLPSLSG